MFFSHKTNICRTVTIRFLQMPAFTDCQPVLWRSIILLTDIDTTRFNELLAQLGIEDLDLILKERRLPWFGHAVHSNGAVKTAFDIQVDGKHGPGRPKITWKQLTERDCREWKLSAIDPHDRHTWRSGVRSAMRAASQL